MACVLDERPSHLDESAGTLAVCKRTYTGAGIVAVTRLQECSKCSRTSMDCLPLAWVYAVMTHTHHRVRGTCCCTNSLDRCCCVWYQSVHTHDRVRGHCSNIAAAVGCLTGIIRCRISLSCMLCCLPSMYVMMLPLTINAVDSCGATQASWLML